MNVNNMGTGASSQFPRIGVVGIGGVGGYLAGMLAASQQKIVLFPRSDYEVISDKGITLTTVKELVETRNFELVDPRAATIPVVDVLILATKSYDLISSITRIRQMKPSPLVVTIQNGVDCDRIVAAELPDCHVVPGLAYIVSRKVMPGVYLQSAGPCTFIFGLRDRKATDTRFQKLIASMQFAGIDASVAVDIERELWLKYIWILAFSGVTALFRDTIGTIMDSEEGRNLFVESVDEAFCVARAMGIKVDESDRMAIVNKGLRYREVGRDSTSSLASDILSNRPTELDVLHNRIVPLIEEKKISAPALCYVQSELNRIIHESVPPERLRY